MTKYSNFLVQFQKTNFTWTFKMNRNYYIKQIRDLSKNYDSDTQSKILDDLTDKFFDVKGIKELYDILMEEVYGDGGIKGY